MRSKRKQALAELAVAAEKMTNYMLDNRLDWQIVERDEDDPWTTTDMVNAFRKAMEPYKNKLLLFAKKGTVYMVEKKFYEEGRFTPDELTKLVPDTEIDISEVG